MNIFIGKIGKSILFNSSLWGPSGGDLDAPVYYENLFHRNPDKKFYLVGASDWERLTPGVRDRINKNKNVVNIWSGFDEWRKQNPDIPKRAREVQYMVWFLKHNKIEFDKGIVFAGPVGTSNVEGFTHLMKDPDKIAVPLEMLAKYAGPIIHFINEIQKPYALIVCDPRYFPPHSKDWMFPPSVVLSQYDETVKFKYKNGYKSTDITEVPTRVQYASTETIFLIGQERDKPFTPVKEETNDLFSFFGDDVNEDIPERSIKFLIVLNEGLPKSRYPQLKSAILDSIQDVEIYGKWDERTIGDDPRFKGTKDFVELQKMLQRVEYTYCIPIKKGWVTSKFWEMVQNGVIPFVSPTYDEQNHLKIPDILRVKNAAELKKVIDFLEETPEAKNLLKKTLQEMLRDDLYSGEYLNQITWEALQDS